MVKSRRSRTSRRVVGKRFMFAAVGMGLMIFSLMTAYERMGAAPQLTNVPWLSIMVAIGVLTATVGFSLVRGLGVDDKKAWGNVFVAIGFGALVFSVFAVHGLVGMVPGPENLTWLAVMLSIGGFLIWRGDPLAFEHGGGTARAWGGVFLGAAVLVMVSSLLLARDMSGGAIAGLNAVWLAMLLAVFVSLLVYGFWRVRETGAGGRVS